MYQYAIFVAIVWALYPFLLRASAVDPLVVWAIMTTTAAVISVSVCCVLKKSLVVPKENLYPIIWASVLGPILGGLLYVFLLSKCPTQTTLVIAIAYMAPLFAVIFGYFIYNERLH